MQQSYEGIARNYANLVEKGLRSVDSIKNTLVRQRVQEMIEEDAKKGAD